MVLTGVMYMADWSDSTSLGSEILISQEFLHSRAFALLVSPHCSCCEATFSVGVAEPSKTVKVFRLQLKMHEFVCVEMLRS